jgi:hypothetical protein
MLCLFSCPGVAFKGSQHTWLKGQGCKESFGLISVKECTKNSSNDCKDEQGQAKLKVSDEVKIALCKWQYSRTFHQSPVKQLTVVRFFGTSC